MANEPLVPVVADAPKDAQTGMSTATRVCGTCVREWAKYTCPRCNAPYCSLTCYKAHSDGCTEQFYKEHVSEELQHRKATPEETKRMMDILKREREELEREERGEDEDDEDEQGGGGNGETDLTAGLDQLDLENLCLDDLTPAQQRDFERAVVDGRLGNAIEAWTPWWEARDVVQDRMSIPEDIPPLAALTKSAPNPVLVAHATDLLFAFAYSMRRHNGELQESAASMAQMSWDLSGVLQGGMLPETPAVALMACLEQARNPQLFNSTGFSLGVLKDLGAICQVEDGSLITRAFAELHGIHAAALPLVRKPRAKRTAAVKKLFFFVAWAKECGAVAVPQIGQAVKKELAKQEEAFKGGEIKMSPGQVTVPMRTAAATSFN